MLGKTSKGMTDARLAWQTGKLLDFLGGADSCTVYVRPELMVEVAPRHTLAAVRRFFRLQQKGEGSAS